MDEKLLHFTKADTAISYILKNQTLRFNSFRNVNDPRESKDWPFKIFCFFEQNCKEFNKELFKELHNYVMNHVFISCFSNISVQENLPEINNDLRMWAQYGDNHKGVCIVFNKSRLEDSIKENANDLNIFHEPIEYTANITNNLYPKQESGIVGITFNNFYYQQILSWLHPFAKLECDDPYMINLERITKIGIPKYMEQHIFYYYHQLFFKKKECWRDEREYRYVIHSSEEKDFIDIPTSNSIEAIIIGNDFPGEYFDQIINIAKEMDFKIYKLFSRGWENHLFECDLNNPFQEDVISLNSSFPINFYYDRLFFQVCDLNGYSRTLHLNSKSGEVSIFD